MFFILFLKIHFNINTIQKQKTIEVKKKFKIFEKHDWITLPNTP